MIIECSSCRTRFRLDESRIKGKAAKVQCRKCGNSIYVTKPDAPSPGPESSLDLRSLLTGPAGTGPAAASMPADREAISAPEPPPAPAVRPGDVGAASGEPPATPDAGTPAGEPFAALPPPVEFAAEETLSFPAEPGEAAFAFAERPVGEEVPLRDALTSAPPEPAGGTAAEEPGALAPPPLESASAASDRAEGGKEITIEPYDISGSLRLRPDSGQGADGTTPPVEAAESAPASRVDELQNELKDLQGPAASPAPPSLPYEDATPMRRPASPAQRSAAEPPRSSFASPVVITLVLLFALLAGGGAFLGFTRNGQEVMRGLVARMDPLISGGKKAVAPYEIENVIGYYEVSPDAGKMFVIKGQVRNAGRSARSGVKVHAAILDAGAREIAKKSAYAGNIVGVDALKHLGREKLEAELSKRFGGNLVNLDVAPGKSVPFMIVFFDAPDGIDAYKIEAKDGD